MLLKKNFLGMKQLRYFVLHDNGEMKYSKQIVEHKGTLVLTAQSVVITNEKKTEMTLKNCTNMEKKNKDSYCLV